VCAGLGRRLGIDPVILRAAFVAAAAAGGAGIILYGLAWALAPAASEDGAPQARRAADWRVAAGVALLALSGLLVLRELGVWSSDALVWPVVLAAAGGALIWRQSASSGRGRTVGPRESSGAGAAEGPRHGQRLALSGAGVIPTLRGRALGRTATGVALVIGAGLAFLFLNGALGALRDVLLGAVAVVVVLAVILAPWWWRLVGRLSEERAERIRSQERAEVAAHLHDSVLQTLALVQRRSHDPREVAGLARRQERELRTWLSGRPPARPDERVAAALEAAAAEVEEDHRVTVDTVLVGDAPLDERGETVVAAAHEALVNAAKFAARAAPVSLYAELDDERMQVFVRDRGPGFDPDAVPADRRGIRDSIVGRMERRGGRAVIHAGNGSAATGTEVELLFERGNGR
jgi:phage shock protein PspC (stress-responsive transcriptional regulator)